MEKRRKDKKRKEQVSAEAISGLKIKAKGLQKFKCLHETDLTGTVLK